MITIREMEEKDIESVIEWSENTEAFLKQWSNYNFPLDQQQIIDRINSDEYIVFAIESNKSLVGTIQIFKFDKQNNSAKIGCYLINPSCRGKGLGTEALKKVVIYAFDELRLSKVALGVFDYNTSAIRCYEKIGFIKKGEYKHPMGWTGYDMEVSKEKM